jgi:hypothetical protein
MGAIWGLGHGLSATFLGACAFFLKGKLTKQFSVVEKLSNLAGSVVGASLVLIGLIGIKESMEEDHDEHNTDNFGTDSLGTKKQGKSMAIMANGALHGFSWDGVPSIAPAIAMSSWQSAMRFLACYSLGTMLAMSLSAGIIGALSTRIGKMANDPALPKKLSFASSMFAVLIGLFWVWQALVGK